MYSGLPTALTIICMTIICNVGAIRFTIESNMKRCLKDELRKNVLVIGNYQLTDAFGVRTDLQITDSKGHTALMRESIDKGKFAITSDEDDIYDFCFISYAQQNTQASSKEVHLDMKHGVEAKNYNELAQVAKLKPLETDLTKIEDLSSSIIKDFEYMMKRGNEMHDTNESTNDRVFYFGIFSIMVLLGLAMWQVLYLRRFFKTKKLID